MIVIICLTEKEGKEYFAHELSGSVFFLTPDSDNTRLKSCAIEKVLVSNHVALDLIPIYELYMLKNRLRDASGDFDAFLTLFNERAKKQIPFWLEKHKPFNEQKEKEILKFWVDEQRGLLEQSLNENMAKFFTFSSCEEKEYSDLMNGRWEIAKPKDNEK